MSRFAPVELSRPLEGRVSQTMLRTYSACPRAGYLYHETKSVLQTVEMVRGSAAHAVYQRGTELMVEQGEPMLPPEMAKVIVDEVLAEYAVPVEEHDFLREQAYRWAQEWTVDPQRVVAVETLFSMDLAGWTVRAKVDHAELRNDGAQIYVADYKTGKGAPAYDDVSRKRTDGSVSPKNFQLLLYVLALKYGRPVQVEPCGVCHGNGELERQVEPTDQDGNRGTDTFACDPCMGRGYVETIEPFPVAAGAQEAIVEFVYPAIEDSEGRMLRRTMGMTALEIAEARESMEAVLGRLSRSVETGDWPAVVSESACNECPAQALCPIPAELNDYAGEINSMDQLVQAAEVYYLEGRRRDAKRKEIKASAKALGGPTARVRFGADRVWELGYQERTEIRDKDGLFDAVQRAVELGEPFERADFVKVSKTTPFGERSLSAEELAEEAAVNDEEGVDGGNDH